MAIILVIGLSALALTSAAGAAGGPWSAYLAPVSACAGSTDRTASPRIQQRAVTCLVNWARARHRQQRLSPSHTLRRAAALKGQGVAACREISHTPCGSDAAAPVRRAGYAYARFGENLYVGVLGAASAREVVSAWLRSPGHRANILHPGYRDFGAALVRADGVFYDGAAVVWIAAFASRW
ncbi:MAG: CAP domain-containing protein [Actinomycetota bacterium]|nr:CAP domain-containing protein [Actinomycetota bacterium]